LNFDIHIDDGSDIDINQFTTEQNKAYLSLYDWQRRAIKFFFKNNNAIFQVSTGCLTSDTVIEMPRDILKYPKGIPIKNLVGKKDFYVYSYNIKIDKIELKKVKRVWLNKKNEDVFEIVTLSGKKIKATKNHPFLINILKNKKCGCIKRDVVVGKEYIKLNDLKVGMYTKVFNRSRIRNSDGELIKYNYNDNSVRRVFEHRFIIEQVERKLTKFEIVHHKDKNKFNNNINNLEILDSRKHNSMHIKENNFYGRKLWEKNGHLKGMKGKHHSKKIKKIISINTKAALNNITYNSYGTDKHSREFLLNGFLSYKYKKNKKSSIEKFKKTIKKKSKSVLSECSKKNRKVRYSDKIISIKYVGKEDVYDMEVEDNHNFIANDFIVHNSGKTFCAIEIIKEIWKKEPDLKALIVVPKNIILETGWYKELYDAGISLRKIGVFYGKIKEEAQITITNMQNIEKLNLKEYDIVVLDEVHNYGTKRMLEYIKYPFKYKIGLSATVDRGDGGHWKIYEIFDYNIFTYLPKQALEEGILNPFDFVNVGVEMDYENFDYYDRLTAEINMILKVGGGFNKIVKGGSGLKNKLYIKLTERKQLVNNYKRKFDVVKKICLKHRDDKVIVFSEYNDSTNKFYWHLLDEGLKACVLHSGISKDKREENITDFKLDKYQIMLTSKVLDEGYNLPKLDVAIIAAGNSTSRQTIQRMGRVLRKKNKESMLYQIYVKDTIEEDQSIERSKLFKGLCSEYKEYIYENKEEEFNWKPVDKI